MSAHGTSIFLILKTVKTENIAKEDTLFVAIKHAFIELAQRTTDNPIYTERSLNAAVIGFITFCKHHIALHDTAPAHKSKIGYKIFGDKMARLNKLTFFKNNGIILFEKVQDSCYITSELASSYLAYNLGYTHTYKLTKSGIELHHLVMNNLRAIKKSPKVKDILGLTRIKNKDIENLDVIKIKFKDYKNMISIHNAIYVHNRGTQELYNSIKGISTVLDNVIGYIGNYVYVHNKKLGKDSEFREYNVYTTISKSLRKIIHPDYIEYDIESSSISAFLNVLVQIDKQKNNKTYIRHKDYKKIRYVKKQYNENDWKYYVPTVCKYLNNKHSSRLKVQNALGHKTINETKTFLTSLNFGSSIGNLKFNENASQKNIIFTKLLIKELLALMKYIKLNFLDRDEEYLRTLTIMGMNGWEVKCLIDESIRKNKEKCRPKDERIIERRKAGEIVKAKCSYGRGKKISSKQLARLYFILEEKIRNEVLEHLSSNGINNYHQIHDCVVFSREYKNCTEKYKLTEHIKEKFGYKLTFSSSEDSNLFNLK